MALTDSPLWMLVVSILVLTATSAYFSSSETAMMSINRYRLRHLVKEKHRGARKANRLLRRPDRLLGVILIGNNLVNALAATVAAVIGMKLFGNAGLAIAPFVFTLFFLIFAEVAPKTIAAHSPEQLAFPSSYILKPLLKISSPLVTLVNVASNAVARPFLPKGYEDRKDHLSLDELRTVVDQGVALPQRRQNMMLNLLDLEKVTVDDIMIPRNEIVGINIDDDMDDILETLETSQHTRLPVFKRNLDNILGILHLRRAIRLERNEEPSKADLLGLTVEPYYVPEATPLHTQLFQFQSTKRRIALVVDEYGEIRGIVTLEDILEEIVGDFTTDFAASIPEIHPQEDGSYFIDGLALIRDINRTLEWKLPLDGPKTLNGLILEHLEMIPEANLCLRLGAYRIETLQVHDNVIKNVRIHCVAVPDDDDDKDADEDEDEDDD